MTTLVMYSGGLDSLAMLWGLPHAVPVRVHHINFTPDQTLGCLRRAVVDSLAYMVTQGKTITYTESFNVLEPFPQGFSIFTQNIVAGQLCQADPSITEVAVGRMADDNYPGMAQRIIDANLILQAAAPGVTKIYPVLGMTKLQLYQSLPQELKDIFWSCRGIAYDDLNFYQCKRCSACEQLAQYNIPHPVYERLP